jgi:hypothetical protein
MAHLTVTVPENSQNIFGTVTIKAPLEKGLCCIYQRGTVC